jgi:hypothetical protein
VNGTIAPWQAFPAEEDEMKRSHQASIPPPFDFEQHFPLVQATRHNLKLCARQDH